MVCTRNDLPGGTVRARRLEENCATYKCSAHEPVTCWVLCISLISDCFNLKETAWPSLDVLLELKNFASTGYVHTLRRFAGRPYSSQSEISGSTRSRTMD